MLQARGHPCLRINNRVDHDPETPRVQVHYRTYPECSEYAGAVSDAAYVSIRAASGSRSTPKDHGAFWVIILGDVSVDRSYADYFRNRKLALGVFFNLPLMFVRHCYEKQAIISCVNQIKSKFLSELILRKEIIINARK